jgi:cytochrome c oxidase assembly factor CtaG
MSLVRVPDPDRSPDIGSLIPRGGGRKLGHVGRPLLLGVAAALVIGAQVSPLAHWADTRSFAAHMGQHLLIGDLAPLAFVLALRGSVRRGVNPLVSWPLWIVNLALWHVPVVYEAALHHEGVHAVQHIALFAGGLLLWTPVFGLAATPGWFGDAARLVYLLLTMFAGVVIGALFLWWPHPIYSTYAHAAGFAGLSPHGDQRVGGGLMLLEGTAVIFAVAAWLVWRITTAEPSAQRSL